MPDGGGPILHDCFGAVVIVKDGTVTILCGDCGKPAGSLDARGLHLVNRHAGGRHENTVPLRALKVAIEQIEKSDYLGRG